MSKPTNAPAKPVTKSKTLWANLAIVVITFVVFGTNAPVVKEWLTQNAEWALTFVGVLNMILRFMTSTPLDVSGPDPD